ncbi:MAG: MBOAT family protein, partial [Peptococcaceae bacterium]|nr:MBOAT family protein [Peptococcaceae bacterium]
KTLQKLPAILQHLYTLFFILISWTIFALEDFSQLQVYLSCMLYFADIPFWNAAATYYLKNYFWILIIAVFASTPCPALLFSKLPYKPAMVSKIILLTIGIMLCTAYVVADSYNPFLYFRF